MTYELPMKDGKVDMDKVLDSIGMCFEVDTPEIIIQAIVSNARAEERERCAVLAAAEIKEAIIGKNTMIIPNIALSIRAMGD